MIGRHIAHYQIREKLGSGGMGVVYKAYDTRLKRTVALKFLPPHLSMDEQAKQRLVHEAQAASALDHANICTIHQIDETEEGYLFIAMAYYQGETLKQKVARGPLPLEEALDYTVQLARGLAHGHAAGIVHRDVKSANMIVTEEGVLKILDFGLAKMAAQISLTQTKTTLGTVAYMSPEQAQGEEVDHRTDLWSLGVVLYEMLTGERPFKGDHEQTVIYAILHTDPDPVSLHRADIPQAVVDVLDGLLRKKPALRTASALDVIAAVTDAEDRVSSRATRVSAPTSRSSRVRRGIALGAPMILAAVLLFWWAWGRSAAPADEKTGLNEPPATPSLIAVFPFAVQGSDDLAYLREGMVTLLSTKFEGAGPLYVVDPNVLLSTLDRDTNRFLSPEEARHVAAQFHAGRYVLGSVTQAGDAVQIDARLYDQEGKEQAAAYAVAEAESQFMTTVDEVARQLVQQELAPRGLVDLISLRSQTTASFEALKAYLKGQHELQDNNWREARPWAEQALAIDSTFAQAWYLLGLSYAVPGDIRNVLLPIRRAQAHAGGLPQRTRLLIDAFYFAQTDRADDAERIYRQLLNRNPRDLEALQNLGQLLYHYNPKRGRPADEAFHYMDQYRLNIAGGRETESIGLFAFTERMRRRDYAAADTLVNHSNAWQNVMYIGIRGSEKERDSLFAVMPYRGIWLLAFAHHFAEAQEAAERTRDNPASPHDRRVGDLQSAVIAFVRGQFQASREQMQKMKAGTADKYILSEVAASLTPYQPYSSDELLALERRLAQWDTTSFEAELSRGAGMRPEDRDALTQRYLIGLLQWRRGDREALAQTAGSIASDPSMQALGRRADSYAKTLQALLAWHDGKRMEALGLLDEAEMMQDWVIIFRSYPRSQVFNRYVRAEILFELGRYEEAIAWYRALFDGFEIQGMQLLPLSYFRRAQCYDKLRQVDQAIDFYNRFLDLWEASDPELRPWVEQAEKARARLLEDRAPERGA